MTQKKENSGKTTKPKMLEKTKQEQVNKTLALTKYNHEDYNYLCFASTKLKSTSFETQAKLHAT